MMYNSQIIIFILIILIYYYANNLLNKYEPFLNIYEIVNNQFKVKEKENNKNITITKKFKNFHDLFLKNIYLSYTENKKYFHFYVFNYEYKLYMKVNINKNNNNFDIRDINNKSLGHLINKHHNRYYINLQNLYKNDYFFLILNNYNTIKIYNNYEYNIFYLKKNNDELKKFKMYIFDEEIGYIHKDNKNLKFHIKKKYLEKINLFCYALIIIIISNQSQ